LRASITVAPVRPVTTMSTVSAVTTVGTGSALLTSEASFSALSALALRTGGTLLPAQPALALRALDALFATGAGFALRTAFTLRPLQTSRPDCAVFAVAPGSTVPTCCTILAGGAGLARSAWDAWSSLWALRPDGSWGRADLLDAVELAPELAEVELAQVYAVT
jgi:hypothetical protein